VQRFKYYLNSCVDKKGHGSLPATAILQVKSLLFVLMSHKLMSTRRNGGIIGPQNRTTSVGAVGMWHLDDIQESVGAKNWPGFTPTIPNAPVGTVTVAGTTATILYGIMVGQQ
jgi:hypothetical protein